MKEKIVQITIAPESEENSSLLVALTSTGRLFRLRNPAYNPLPVAGQWDELPTPDELD